MANYMEMKNHKPESSNSQLCTVSENWHKTFISFSVTTTDMGEFLDWMHEHFGLDEDNTRWVWSHDYFAGDEEVDIYIGLARLDDYTLFRLTWL